MRREKGENKKRKRKGKYIIKKEKREKSKGHRSWWLSWMAVVLMGFGFG